MTILKTKYFFKFFNFFYLFGHQEKGMDGISVDANNSINNKTETDSTNSVLSTTAEHDLYSKMMDSIVFNDKIDTSNNSGDAQSSSSSNNNNNNNNRTKKKSDGIVKTEHSSFVDNQINSNENVRIKEKYVELIELHGKRVSKTSKGKKKFHFKSRTGCINCKRKRIKCDETKPVCMKCQNSKLQCVYANVQSANDGNQPGSGSENNSPIANDNINNALGNISNHLLQNDNKRKKTTKRRVKTVIKYITRKEDGTVEISDKFEDSKKDDKNSIKKMKNEPHHMEQNNLLNDPTDYHNVVKTELGNNNNNNKDTIKNFNDNLHNNNNNNNLNMNINPNAVINSTQNFLNQNIPNEINGNQNIIMQGLYALQSLMLQNLSNNMRVDDDTQTQSPFNNIANLLYKNCNNNNNNLTAVMNGLLNLTSQQGNTPSLNSINTNLLLNLLANTNAINQLQNELNMSHAMNHSSNNIRQGSDIFQNSTSINTLTNNIPTPLNITSNNLINSVHGMGFVNDPTDTNNNNNSSSSSSNNNSNSNINGYLNGPNLPNMINSSSINSPNISNNKNVGINPHMINNSTKQQLQYHLNQQLQLQQHQQIQLQQNQQYHIQQQQQLQNQQQQFLQQLLDHDLTQSTLDQSVLLSTQLQQQQAQMQLSLSPILLNEETFGQLNKNSLQKLHQPLDVGNQNDNANNNTEATNNERENMNNSDNIDINKLSFSKNKNSMFQTAGIGGIDYDFQELLGIKLNSHRMESKISNAQEALATMQKETERTSRRENSNDNITNLNDSIKEPYDTNNTNNILTDGSNDSSNSLEKTDTSPMLQENTTSATSLLSQMTETTLNSALSPTSPLLTRNMSITKSKSSNNNTNNIGKGHNSISKLLSLSTKANLNLVDMKLFYHYCTTVCYTVGSSQDSATKVWSKNVPELAFQYPYLMHSLLAFSATHLSRTLSGLEQYVSSHRLDALKLLREAVLEVSDDNTDALVASALLLIMDSLANATNTGSGLSVQSSSAWIFHVKGASTILTAVWPLKETSIFHELISVDLTNLGNFINEEDGTVSELVCFDDSISDLYPVDINSPYLITLAYLNKLHNEINTSSLIFKIFTFPALLDKTFLALLMTGDINAMRIMRAYYKLLTNFTTRMKEEFWFLEGISQVLPEDVDEYSGGGGMHMMLDFLGGGLPSMTLSNLSDFM